MAAVIEIPHEALKEELLEPGVYRFNVRQYARMLEAGVIGEDDRLELIEGRIVRMAPKNLRHAIATKRANRCFSKLLDDRVIVSVQDPILLNDLSESEPDIALLAPPEIRYLQNHPKPADIYLVLEIADSSLPFDRDVKCPLFAQNGILQFCLLNLQAREVEDYQDPSENGYRKKMTYGEQDSFRLLAFPEILIKVDELLPPIDTELK